LNTEQTLTLRNQSVELQLQRPGIGYNGTRFDQTGKILKCSMDGISVCSQEWPMDRMRSDLGVGFMNEFDMQRPPGFDEAELGERFLKIGVGALQKEEATYDFLKRHSCMASEFSLSRTQEEVWIRSESPEVLGHACALDKHIRLTDNGFSIGYRLQNLGSKVLRVQEYVHNFLAFAGHPIGPAYRIDLPHSIDISSLTEYVDELNAVSIGDRHIGFRKPLEQPIFLKSLGTGALAAPSWQLSHEAIDWVLTESVDRPLTGIHLWAWGHVISPELFVNVQVPCGAEVKWERRFEFHKKAPLGRG